MITINYGEDKALNCKVKVSKAQTFQKQFCKEKSIVEANKEIVNLTLQASSKLLERSVNEDDDKKFVDDFVKKMKGENK